MSYRLLSGALVVALSVAFAAPGAAQASTATTKASPTAAVSAASAGSSNAESPAAARPGAGSFRAVDGHEVAVPQVSAATAGTPRPTPSGPVLSVDNAAAADCSDTASGAGTQAVPFCTLQAAANAVVAGDTVLVTPGVYAGFTLSAQGTAAAPIAFEASVIGAPFQNYDSILIAPPLKAGTVSTPVHAIDVENSSYVDLENFRISELVSSDAVLINASQHITVDEFLDWVSYIPHDQPAPDIHVTGDSSYVTVTRASGFNANSAPYVQVDAGGSNDVIADNAFWGDYGTMISIAGTPNAAITGNTFLMSYSTAISLTGNSPNSAVEDNIVSFNRFSGTDTTSIVVGTGSTSGTTLDYNVVEPTSDPAYQWGSATYATAAALGSATGQGAHEIYATPDLYVGGDVLILGYDSIGIDAADAAAHGEQATDIYGQSCVDDPSYAVTGAGTPAYCSRGSFQYQDALTGLVTATETGSMSVKADATQSHGLNGIASYSFDFGDGGAPVVNTTGTATHTYMHSGAYSITVTVTDSTGATDTSVAAPVKTLGADFTAMSPVRVLDTRSGIGSGTVAPVSAGGDVSFPVPAAAASHGDLLKAVVLNVTVTDTTGNGYVGVSSGTSSVNYRAGQTLAATVLAQVWNNNGTLSVTLFDSGVGKVDLIADMTGFFAGDATDGYQPIAPARLLDTRSGIGGSTGPLTSARPDVVTVAGADGGTIPAGITAVAVNLTAAQTSGTGLVAAYPDGTTSPGTSNINFGAGQTLSNFAVIPVGADGEIDFADSGAATELIVDVVGYFDAAGGSGFVAAPDPYRDIDTRTGNPEGYCTSAKGALAGDGTLTANVVCPTAGFPSGANPGDVTAVAVNNTVTEDTASGYLVSYPAGGTLPIASDLDWQRANQTVADFTIAGTGEGGEISYANRSSGTVQLIVDVYGYFASS